MKTRGTKPTGWLGNMPSSSRERLDERSHRVKDFQVSRPQPSRVALRVSVHRLRSRARRIEEEPETTRRVTMVSWVIGVLTHHGGMKSALRHSDDVSSRVLGVLVFTWVRQQMYSYMPLESKMGTQRPEPSRKFIRALGALGRRCRVQGGAVVWLPR